MDIVVRKLADSEMELALALVWEVFQEYEAPDYSVQGVMEFKETIHDPQWLSMLQLYGAFDKDYLAGMIASRNNGSHIALFFVKSTYQKKGIANSLCRILSSRVVQK